MAFVIGIVCAIALGLFVGLQHESYYHIVLTATLASAIWLWQFWYLIRDAVMPTYNVTAVWVTLTNVTLMILTVGIGFVGIESATYFLSRWLTG